MAAIPRIVLDDRAIDSPDPLSPSSTPVTTSTSNGPLLVMGPGRGGGRPLSGGEGMDTHDYVPHRCNSDIGLPTTSMPNLPLAMGMGDHHHGEGGDKLGVYCSPRTTRRSVDLEVGSSRDPGAPSGGGEYEWLGGKAASLQVLSAGSRVGSAISLNSVCTAHSVGLLSNDSSDEYQDSFLQEVSLLSFPPHAQRASHLRRFQSNPEAEEKSGNDTSVTPRTSYSLCNLKAAQAPAAGREQGPNRGQLTPEKLCLLPSDLDECEDGALPPGESESRREGEEGEEKGGSKVADMEVCEDSPQAHMVSYGKGSSTMREGRIRRWLQDMDKATE
ncbi:uncharacterized protein LOC143286470 [Babylonia areolata]|uniref:uncharacterized protein LOC143286470 n=1 Tax=Babylonia areolata TaxID=304850 RepID=UPI003FD502EA